MNRKVVRSIHAALAVVLAAMVLVVSKPTQVYARTYDDVSSDAWFYDAVEWAARENVMTGFGGTNLFHPYDDLTRAQEASVLYRYLGNGERVGAARFSDVRQSDWYAPAVNWVAKSGVMTGYGNGRFGVDNTLTREELAAVMSRICNAKLSKSTSAAFNKFPDHGDTSSWARKAMVWAVDNGIINGNLGANGKRILAPRANVSRAQVAAIMRNAVNKGLLSKKGSHGTHAAANAGNAYASVISAYRSALKSDGEPTSEYVSWQAWQDKGNYTYTFYDLNGDGTDELLIGMQETQVSPVDGKTIVPYRLYDLYTLVGNKPTRMIDPYSLGYRVICIPCEDSKLEVYGSGGAYYYGYDFYNIGSDATNLITTDSVEVDHDAYTFKAGKSGSAATLGSSAGKARLDRIIASYTPITRFSWTKL